MVVDRWFLENVGRVFILVIGCVGLVKIVEGVLVGKWLCLEEYVILFVIFFGLLIKLLLESMGFVGCWV